MKAGSRPWARGGPGLLFVSHCCSPSSRPSGLCISSEAVSGHTAAGTAYNHSASSLCQVSPSWAPQSQPWEAGVIHEGHWIEEHRALREGKARVRGPAARRGGNLDLLRAGEDWGQDSWVLSAGECGDLGGHPSKVSVSPSHPTVLTTSGSGGAAWRVLPGPQEAPRSSSSRLRAQHHSTAGAQGCLQEGEGPREGGGQCPQPPHCPEPDFPKF